MLSKLKAWWLIEGPSLNSVHPATPQPCRAVVPVNPALGYYLEFVREQVGGRKVSEVVNSVDALALTASGNVGRRELAQVVPLELTAS